MDKGIHNTVSGVTQATTCGDTNLRITHNYNTIDIKINEHFKSNKNLVQDGTSKDDENENNVSIDNDDEIKKKYALASSNEEQQRCNESSKKNITTKNFISFCNLADKDKNEELSLLTEQFITKNFMNVIEEDDFLKLRPEKLEKILSSDNLNVASEAYAFEALKKWYNNENDKRREFCRLLKHIRFTHLSDKYFPTNVRKELDKCNLCERKNELIPDWYTFPHENRPSYEFNVNPRRYYDEALLQITTNDNLEYVHIKKYNPEEKSWSKFRPITTNINYSIAKILDGKLILLGGHDQDNKVTCKTWCIDMRRDFGELEIKPMQQGRIFSEAVIMDKKLLVFGGIDDDRKEVHSVEMWDSSTQVWTQVDQMSQPRYHPTGVFYKGKAYVFGGYNNNAYSKSFEIYDSNAKIWTRFNMGPDIECFDYCHIKSTVLDDDIYVYECFKDSSTYDHHLKRFNPSISNTEWVFLPQIPIPQECRYLITHERKIVFFGSEKNYEYSPEINKWSEFSSQEILDNYNHIFSVPKTTL